MKARILNAPRKPGRPTDAAKTALVKVRTTPGEKAQWIQASASLPLSEWLRRAANNEAKGN